MILNGEEGEQSHLLSSLHITIVDRPDVMIQQNWEHIGIIFSHIGKQPQKILTDISKVARQYLGELSSWSQCNSFI